MKTILAVLATSGLAITTHRADTTAAGNPIRKVWFDGWEKVHMSNPRGKQVNHPWGVRISEFSWSNRKCSCGVQNWELESAAFWTRLSDVFFQCFDHVIFEKQPARWCL